MVSLADEPDWADIVYYGNYGTGKTTSLAFLAQLGVVKWIRADRGIKPARLRTLGIDINRIEPVDNFDPRSMEQNVEEWREALEAKPGSITGVCVDTGTELVARRIEVYVDEDWRKVRQQARQARIEPNWMDRYTAGDVRDQYKGVTQELRRLTRHLHDLPCHVGIACQMRRDVDEKTSRVMYGPALPPGLGGDIIGYAGIVIRTEMEGEWPDGTPLIVGYPRPTDTYVGKDQYGVLPSRVAMPTYPRLLSYIRGELTKDTDEIQAQYRDLVKQRAKEDEL